MYLVNKKNLIKIWHYGFILLVISVLNINTVQGQVLQNKDTTKTEKVQVFSNSGNPNKYFDESNSKLWNVIKINPLLALSGEIPIYFERRLTKKTSVEVGLGPTLKDPTYPAYLLVFQDFELSGDNLNYKMGITFKGMFRYYPTDYGFPEGFYFGPEIRFKNYSAIYTYDALNGTGGTHTVPIKRSYTDLLLSVGNQTEIDDNIYVDYYGGIGIRFKNVDNLEQGYDSQGYQIYLPNAKHTSIPLISMGIKFGFAF